MTLCTLYALFGDDIRLLATNRYADGIFYSFTIVAMCLFSAEIVLLCICNPDYLYSFYFWLDLVSTLTMIMDVGWIWESFDSGATVQAQKISQMARASKGARLGSKASRLIRVIRLIRMLRIVKLYKHSNTVLAKKAKVDNNEEDEFIEEMMQQRAAEIEIEGTNEVLPEESKIGKMLSDVTTKRVIIMVLIIMLSMPLFATQTYEAVTKSFGIGLDLIAKYDSEPNGTSFHKSFNTYVQYHKTLRTPLIYIKAQDMEYEDYSVNQDNLRNSEKEIISPSNSSLTDYYISVFDMRADTHLDALLGILQMIFVCIMLAVGAFLFTKDATEFVIEPIEQMMTKVKRIAKNPLEAAKEEENEAAALKMAEAQERRQNQALCCVARREQKLETALLEQTIVKTGSLLAIGLGEAGSKIIAQNIANNTTGGNIDPLIPGTKVFAVFGFCDVRNFTDTTEILQEEVMVFVNEVADIIHGYTHRYLGYPNKNIGDAFLTVWKFLDKDVQTVDDKIELKDSSTVSAMADMAAISFILIIAAINKSKKIAKYREYKALNERMPNYRVKMGFGIHAGWAIEGAIGSEYKIDASYISPHVNLAMALDEATKIYGVPFVITADYYKLISKEMQEAMRPLDNVEFHGYSEPITLYTFDVDTSVLEANMDDEKEMPKEVRVLQRVYARERRDIIYKGVVEGKYKVKNKLKQDKDIKAMRRCFTQVNLILNKTKQEFFETYRKGYDQYIAGDWEDAKELLESVNKMLPSGDNPSKALLVYMRNYGYKAPADWKGSHKFAEKQQDLRVLKNNNHQLQWLLQQQSKKRLQQGWLNNSPYLLHLHIQWQYLCILSIYIIISLLSPWKHISNQHTLKIMDITYFNKQTKQCCLYFSSCPVPAASHACCITAKGKNSLYQTSVESSASFPQNLKSKIAKARTILPFFRNFLLLNQKQRLMRHDYIKFKEMSGNEILLNMQYCEHFRPTEVVGSLVALSHIRDQTKHDWNKHPSVLQTLERLLNLLPQLKKPQIVQTGFVLDRLRIKSDGFASDLLKSIRGMEQVGGNTSQGVPPINPQRLL
eukprot:TRINITY_DN4865_c0_g1_i1.p1 TRINITY_DN4865_c0_g1~~TRINITY_DN4865_c0_g1_i1.p1  ORF type:complete len:1061 (-),score=72.97 TRINITY_DN4865_c0_g1_i1:835-4017(-)